MNQHGLSHFSTVMFLLNSTTQHKLQHIGFHLSPICSSVQDPNAKIVHSYSILLICMYMMMNHPLFTKRGVVIHTYICIYIIHTGCWTCKHPPLYSFCFIFRTFSLSPLHLITFKPTQIYNIIYCLCEWCSCILCYFCPFMHRKPWKYRWKYLVQQKYRAETRPINKKWGRVWSVLSFLPKGIDIQ